MLEFGTYGFDAEKALERAGALLETGEQIESRRAMLFTMAGNSELERFLCLFDRRKLAADLFPNDIPRLIVDWQPHGESGEALSDSGQIDLSCFDFSGAGQHGRQSQPGCFVWKISA